MTKRLKFFRRTHSKPCKEYDRFIREHDGERSYLVYDEDDNMARLCLKVKNKIISFPRLPSETWKITDHGDSISLEGSILRRYYDHNTERSYGVQAHFYINHNRISVCSDSPFTEKDIVI